MVAVKNQYVIIMSKQSTKKKKKKKKKRKTTGSHQATQREQENGRTDLGRGEPGRLFSRHQRHPGAALQRQPRVRVPEGRHEEPRDSGGPREAVHLRVPGHPAGRQQGPQLQYHAGLASSLLNQQSLKRSANQMGASAKRRPKVQPSTLVLPPQYVDDVISRVGRMFPDMTIELFRPNGTSAVLLVTLGKVLKAIVVMRSLFIDRTVVRGFNENVYSEDGKLDIWTKSQYLVFQKVTDHATTALLHYQLPQMPDVVVRSFMTWLRSYIKLFQSSCQRCGRFLQEGLPPTWRDFRTLEAFHDTCRL
ncbi:mediator of RNA polymerase II transcription subunit 27 isoform X2 [Girardinichthys multiradiatus]|uniref:mediator of RNA polymerase II transcription subunit 27 isoform X2 n=1 Tax=Girardinichthys multiradiatus TaxID=208333 RepID=UPI001FAC61D0|nr:mediator of RNA polymerase II transcription subunit 27 isoform X2 [Girardinichthys multiradiatus]